ncbi:hypothetical protein FVEG_15045 [Fusarium verticillioides 7600]|uniref:Uncharacterized protein n=1 Tax=Gibberella moniliformis (strain M3125 / FGSC 7600) TaxID=334819 RepID=W7LJP1_GIBM7|nr:hypothetical protein FVEG_15045 [Fusarium verticillioides 7600]EWG39608.1 hypothetical protein FVEG_15045 [Fusarium verticillioides 7600]
MDTLQYQSNQPSKILAPPNLALSGSPHATTTATADAFHCSGGKNQVQAPLSILSKCLALSDLGLCSSCVQTYQPPFPPPALKSDYEAALRPHFRLRLSKPYPVLDREGYTNSKLRAVIMDVELATCSSLLMIP